MGTCVNVDVTMLTWLFSCLLLIQVCNEDQRERLLEQLRVQLPYLKR